MKALKITNNHGWTPDDLRKYEKKIQYGNMRQRVMTVRLIMEHYTGKEAAHCQEADNCKAPSFRAFVDYVLDYYQGKTVTMVLDNAKIHDADGLQSFFEENENRLIRIFLPKYSPNLNPVERI